MPWQPGDVEPPNAELALTGALRAALTAEDEADVYVSRSIPTSRRTRMVIVSRDGGAFDGILDRPRIRLRIWDASPLAATDLARLVVRLMLNLPGTAGVVRVAHQSGPYEVPDTSGSTQLYLLFDVTIRGVVPA